MPASFDVLTHAPGLLAVLTLACASRAQVVPSPLDVRERGQLEAALDLKTTYGSRVWPGFGASQLPLILYDDQREVLVGVASPPDPWRAVGAELFRGQRVFWRPKSSAQAFAVRELLIRTVIRTVPGTFSPRAR